MMELGLSGELYALISAIAWAFSALVVNYALENKPVGDDPYNTTLGLVISLVTGCFFLSFIVYPRIEVANFTNYLILAGLFTFPIGTGLYYHTSELYQQHAEIAAQFVKIKPIFSVILAFGLGEIISRSMQLSLVFISVGLGLLILATVRGRYTKFAIVFGLCTALAWSIGEAFMKLGVEGSSSLVATYVALIAGTAVYLVFAIPLVVKNIELRESLAQRWVIGFFAHGLLSFAIAYSAFFSAIKSIGLGRSALITAFWPILALFLSLVFDKVRGNQIDIEMDLRYILAASTMLVAGSLLATI